RNPVIVVLSAAVAASLVMGTVVALAFARYAFQQARQARNLAGLASASATRANQEKVRASRNAEESRRHAEDAEFNLYVTRMYLARIALEGDNIARASEILELYRHPQAGRKDPRSWEWYYLDRACHKELRALEGQPEDPHAFEANSTTLQ